MGRKRKLDEITSNNKLHKQDNYDPTQSSYSNLPHEILLKIFSSLNLKQRCQIAVVCKSWRKAVYDDFLWHHIEIDSFVSLKHFWKLIRHRCFSNAKSIKIIGNLNNVDSNKNQQSISPAFMQKICSTCKELNSLEIRYADLSCIEVTDLPDDIKQLKLIRCEIPINWFINNKFKSLVELDLSQSSRIRTKDLQDLSNCSKSLEVLKLKGCYRLNDKIMDVLIDENFKKIKFLDLEDVPDLTSQLLQSIISKFIKISPNFSYLNVKKCNKINTNLFVEIFDKLNINIDC